MVMRSLLGPASSLFAITTVAAALAVALAAEMLTADLRACVLTMV